MFFAPISIYMPGGIGEHFVIFQNILSHHTARKYPLNVKKTRQEKLFLVSNSLHRDGAIKWHALIK